MRDGQLKKPSNNITFKHLLPDYKFTSIETGLDETIKWFENNYDKARK